jgi:hypothetical protein
VDFALIIDGYQAVLYDYQLVPDDYQAVLYDYQAVEVIMALYSNFIGVPFVERFFFNENLV